MQDSCCLFKEKECYLLVNTTDMITFSNAKINIGLNIIGKRLDGYHNLETVFYPIPIEDPLEIHIKDKSDSTISLFTFGKKIDGDISSNLVVKAYELLKKDFELPSVNVYLYKNIPSGAGLGGGSSNASFAIKLLNKKFNLNLSNQQMEDYAKQLGADCPFFIQNKPVFAEGIGELFTPIPLDLKGYKLVLIKPQLFVSTQEAFQGIQPHQAENLLLDCIKLPIHKWKDYIFNDFERPLFKSHPELKEIKTFLYDSGAIYASVSGSGPSIYGIFKAQDSLPDLSAFEEFYICDL